LADNVKHPFNEFLLLIVEFGIIAFLILLLLAASLIRSYLKNKNEESFVLILCLAAVFIFSCFSYPFQYPFTWLIVGFCISYLSSTLYNYQERSPNKFRIFKHAVALLSIVLLSFNMKNMYYDRKWNQAINQIKHGTTKELLSEYENLHPDFHNNPFFLYNYAALLNNMRYWDNSAEIIRSCEKYLNDCDIQMLKGDNYKKRHHLMQAKVCFELASQMCPGKFAPLFELVNVYDSINQPIRAKELADHIINMQVKVPSATITAIKMRMIKRVEAE
jgi:tetratricopeptide (TPR) repeat protein